MDYECVLDIFEELPRKAKLLIVEYGCFEILDKIYLLSCEKQSPIEIIFLVALLILKEKKNIAFAVEPQYEVVCNGKRYYLDFSIIHYGCLNDDLKEEFKLAIECDGYEFHQKTKEQVDYDNQREYDLKIQGFEILRFSGREIYNNPMGCAMKVINFIVDRNEINLNER